MNQEFHAIYENGVLRPDRPLELPESARVAVIVLDSGTVPTELSPASDGDFGRELDELSLDVPILPDDFSRASIDTEAN